MPHPTEGLLRQLLDEPAGIPDADRRHVAECDECRLELVAIREDADAVFAALAGDADVDLDAAWQRLSTAAAARPAPLRRRTNRVRSALRRPVVAGAAVAAVLIGGGTAAANDWLEIFETEQIAPIGFDTTELDALPDLADYGELEFSGDPDLDEVDGAEVAAAETGLDIPRVADLPRGVDGEPTYRVGGEASVTFTFSAERAAEAAEDAGERLPPLPAGLDGSRVRFVAGPGVAAIWPGSSGVPSLVVGRARAPRAFSAAGVPFETMRDYLLSLPGLPGDVADRLRSFDPEGSTLPLPFPSDRVTTSTARVGGQPATVLATHDRSMAAVTWVEDGVLTVVAGSLDTDEVLAVARGLR